MAKPGGSGPTAGLLNLAKAEHYRGAARGLRFECSEADAREPEWL